jgi:hypothetical protein
LSIQAPVTNARAARSEPLRGGGHTDPDQAAQRRAWICLGAAFAVFCTLAVLALTGANTWRKTAYLAPAALLIEKRGIVLYQGPRDSLPVSVTEGTDLEEGGTIYVPISSEATIHLRVDNSIVRMRSNTQIRLSNMRVGRFNRDLTQVRLDMVHGAANYQIAGELPGGREVEVRTPNTPGSADSLKLTKGDYLVWVQAAGTRLIAYSGQARAEVNGSLVRLRDNKWVLVGPEARAAFDLPEHLIKNRDFAKGLGEAWSPIDIGETGRPDVGGQRKVEDVTIFGQPHRSLRLTRDTAKDTHNETGLRQEVDRDVWAYRGITLAAWVRVMSASLDGGGYVGSEYPMMLRVNYVAENGGSYSWSHGFYVKNDSGRPTGNGEQVPVNEWYRFSLDMTKLKERPAYITSVDVFASGHDYDAEIAGIDLTVE